jgi:hypothetical protein
MVSQPEGILHARIQKQMQVHAFTIKNIAACARIDWANTLFHAEISNCCPFYSFPFWEKVGMGQRWSNASGLYCPGATKNAGCGLAPAGFEGGETPSHPSPKGGKVPSGCVDRDHPAS